MNRSSKLLKRNNTALLIIDIQDRILNVVNNKERVIENTLKLVKGFKAMELPVFFTEQYPKGLGTTTKVILDELTDYTAIQKMSFSCFGAENLFDTFLNNEIGQIVICGIESHVCVQQTVLDLLENNFQVIVAADAVSSRREFDFEIALQRMRTNGAEITTSESILFELLEICGTDLFKSVAKIIK